jgi:hypothetical protein
MARHVCQATTASRGRRQSVSPEGDRMNKTKRFHGWMAVQVEPTGWSALDSERHCAVTHSVRQCAFYAVYAMTKDDVMQGVRMP